MPKTTHGMYYTRAYSTWRAMVNRCTNPRNQAWPDYGGRGIKVCKRWLKFEGFYADMGDPPAGLTLDRKKNHLGYSKTNCVWVTRKTQQNNRRANVVLTLGRTKKNVTQWAEHLGIDRAMIYDRLRKGWTAERALTTPKRGT